MALTAVALLAMPLLGRAKHKLVARLGSAATAREGTQNYLCAAGPPPCCSRSPSPPPGRRLVGGPAHRSGHRGRGSAGRHRILARRLLLLTASSGQQRGK
jgi:hypothetical protein